MTLTMERILRLSIRLPQGVSARHPGPASGGKMNKISCPAAPIPGSHMICCFKDSTKAGPGSGMKMRRSNTVFVAATAAAFALAVVMVNCARAVETASPPPAAGTNAAAPTEIIPPSPVSLPSVPAEALQMSESGMDDDLIVSFIQKSANAYALDADQIIYLHDLGVSSAVLNALVAHGQAMTGGGTDEFSSGTSDVQDVSTNEVPPVSGAAAGYYDALSPYGAWVDVPGYGWCWQPTVVVVNPDWQPYCDNGCWEWTDQGWYWDSYYTWGWAPFHYGRWCQYPGYGWLWCPDNTWGPAWVCWRDYPGYCGWAPLPPGACFTAGLGWTYNGLAVGLNFGFNLRPRCFTFCDYNDFCSRHPFDRFQHGRDADRFFHDSRVDNAFALDAQHHFVNRGIDPSRIEAATHTPIRPVVVSGFSHGTGHPGNFNLPGRNISAPRGPFIAGRNPQFSGWRGGFASAGGNPVGHTFVRPSQFQPPRQVELPQRSTPAPVFNNNHPSWHTFTPRWNNGGNYQAPRAPASGYHAYDFHPVPSAPAWHPAPSWSAPRTYSRPAPAPSVTRSWGGGTQSSGRNFGGGNFGGGGGYHR